MSETANQSPSQFLAERTELRGAYSNIILSKDDAAKQYLAKAKQCWAEAEQFHGADGVMEKFLFENQLIRPELIPEARKAIDGLKQYHYGFKRDVSMVKDAVNRFAAPHAPNAWYKPGYQQMLEWMRKEIKPTYWLMSVKFDSVDALREFLSNPNASAGVLACYSTIKKKKDVVTKKMLDLLHELERLAVRNGTMGEPTLPGIRLQTSIPLDDFGELKFRTDEEGRKVLDFKFKTRLINMVSMPRIMQEMHYSIEVQAVFGSMKWYAGGKTPDELFQIISNNRMKYSNWDSLDYSAYDQSLPGWFIADAFKILKGWFKFRSDYDEKRWDVMVHDFIHKGLVSDAAGNITRIHDGVESGSMFTQIIDTLCNFMMMVYFCIIKQKKMFKDCMCNICGDDNVVFHNGWFDGREYLNTIRKVFGVIGNATKSSLGKTRKDDVEYLSRIWRQNGVYRYWKELLVKLIYHEKYREYTSEVTPAHIFKAFIDCYPLGMQEGFDTQRFYHLNSDHSIGGMSDEAKRSIGGIIAYEMIYGHHNAA